ncbi:hypothetical protein HUN08_13480 [Gordonia sp. X0973]|uniref:hypothetical protein n=1 Tax=Gordonia sp. X0973 TaxID=2742602 RepID=UPI000F545D6A|nr:hypothetical protein [Gordonia sp. X0973]QKT08085.1 hypothetical protein HUN08_13480 [Gordonia sp. X0973]
MWLGVAGVAGARPLWDPEFAEHYSFGRRAWEVFWKYYGPIGLLVSVLYNVQLSVVNDHFHPPSWYHGGTFMVIVVVIGVALFAVPRTPFRQIGSGLFVGVAALAWPILIYPVLFLVLPYLVYLATIITSWTIARRRAKADEPQT